MKEVFPSYYNKFKCIADKCEHNCCIGWEIDIDDETLELYNSLEGKMGKKIRANIEGEVPHFILQDGDRCPFLNEQGLCDIITEYGEAALCDICTLHPRFRNYYRDFFETGLGLCCEEAARIIIFEEEKFKIQLPLNTHITIKEKEFFRIRSEIFDILQNRQLKTSQRFLELAKKFHLGFSFSLPVLCEKYLSLERLDTTWTEELEILKLYKFNGEIFNDAEFDLIFEQLSAYFVFRHITADIDRNEYANRIRFILMSCYLIGSLWSYHKHLKGNISKGQIIDIVRMYSSEIEYSEENTEELISFNSI